MAALTAALPHNADLLTYELGAVDRLLARVASFTLISPNKSGNNSPIEVGGRLVGIEIRQPLHQLDVDLEPPSLARGVRAVNRVGVAAMAEMAVELRWIRDDFVAAPGLRPPPTVFDPGRSQRFALLDCHLRFPGAGSQRLELFGTGRTFPIPGETPRVRLGAALSIVRGLGPFQNLPGMLACNGIFEPPAGFSTALLLRIADFSGRLVAKIPTPATSTVANPDPRSTFLIAKGENDFRHSTALILGLDGGILGADLRQTLRRVQIRSTAGPRGVASAVQIGAAVAQMRATMWFDPLTPSPVPFTTERGIFTFSNREHRPVGWLEANIAEGRGFQTPLPGAPTPLLRGVGLAPMVRGSGCFDGAQGLVTVANWISIFPRQVSSIFLMRVDDPDGRFRAPAGSPESW